METHPTQSRRCGPTERRRYGRFTSRLPIRTRRDDLIRRGRGQRLAECRLQLCDFSLGGLRAESPIPLKVNERLTLHLPATGRHPSIRMTGRVVHCRRLEDTYQVGIAFQETEPSGRASPYIRLPRLFSVAADFAERLEPVSNGDR